jgi:DNA ligase 1
MADIADGEKVEIKGSAAKPYVLTNIGGVYSCSCPAWRNQSIAIERRTCKHLRKYRGDQEEKDRIGGELPSRPVKSVAPSSQAPPILLAHAWDNSTDLAGWWISEKLDGVRAYWNGKIFVSRQGNEFMAPEWFTEGLPPTPLDGELWLDRKAFQRTVSIVRRQDRSDHWKDIRYLVFDAPSQADPFEERLANLEFVFRNTIPFASLHKHYRCESIDHLRQELVRVESLGGEGLMLREPGSNYEIGRSTSLLKVKTFHDAEATVVGIQNGKGKHKGRMGALIVHLADGTEFSVGTGFSDKQRENPPELGATITFRYQELTDAGVPRFPSFLRATGESGSPGNVIPAEPPSTKSGRSPASRGTAVKTAKRAGKTAEKTKDGGTEDSQGGTYTRFEFSDGKSSKFWEIAVLGTETVTRWGRIGAEGQSKSKTFADAEKAQESATKLIQEKTAKGYIEQS